MQPIYNKQTCTLAKKHPDTQYSRLCFLELKIYPENFTRQTENVRPISWPYVSYCSIKTKVIFKYVCWNPRDKLIKLLCMQERGGLWLYQISYPQFVVFILFVCNMHAYLYISRLARSIIPRHIQFTPCGNSRKSFLWAVHIRTTQYTNPPIRAESFYVIQK